MTKVMQATALAPPQLCHCICSWHNPLYQVDLCYTYICCYLLFCWSNSSINTSSPPSMYGGFLAPPSALSSLNSGPNQGSIGLCYDVQCEVSHEDGELGSWCKLVVVWKKGMVWRSRKVRWRRWIRRMKGHQRWRWQWEELQVIQTPIYQTQSLCTGTRTS